MSSKTPWGWILAGAAAIFVVARNISAAPMPQAARAPRPGPTGATGVPTSGPTGTTGVTGTWLVGVTGTTGAVGLTGAGGGVVVQSRPVPIDPSTVTPFEAAKILATVQGQLRALGYNIDRIDGIQSDATTAAAQQFYADHRAAVDAEAARVHSHDDWVVLVILDDIYRAAFNLPSAVAPTPLGATGA